jgi:hypothetical protein
MTATPRDDSLRRAARDRPEKRRPALEKMTVTSNMLYARKSAAAGSN